MFSKNYREQWFRWAGHRWPWAKEPWLLKQWQRHVRARLREEEGKHRIQGRLFTEGRS
jgi:hypothetical protein